MTDAQHDWLSRCVFMKRTLINPADIAPPISKYTHGVRVEIGDTALIFVSGQIALDSEGKIIGLGDITTQTDYVFKEMEVILKACGASLEDVVKATIFVTDMRNFQKVASVRNKYFSETPPATTFVEVNKLVHDDCLVEIEAIAAIEK